MLIVLEDGCGQMCNKLLQQVNYLASSYVRDYDLLYYNMESFSGFKLSQKELERKLIKKSGNTKWPLTLAKVWFKSLRLLKIQSKCVFSAYDNDLVGTNFFLEKKHYLSHKAFSYGFPFLDIEALIKAGDLVRLYLEPDNDVEKYIEQMQERYSGEVCIGVHMRRGDYKYWQGGAYFYSNNQYKQVMDRVYDLLKNQNSTINFRFLLFSNEKIEINEFQDKKYKVDHISGNAEQDFHMLSKCDYIVGPPSTFSGLASFLGKVKRYTIYNYEYDLKLSDFLVWLEEDQTII